MIAINAIGENEPGPTSRGDVISALFYKPADDERYGNGWGGEYQTRAWLNESVGAALSVGIAFWQADGRLTEISPDGVPIIAELDGDVRLVPVGGSLLLRRALFEKTAVTLEGGIRYVAVNADADYTLSLGGEEGTVIEETVKLDLDNGVVGVVGLSFETSVGDSYDLLIGLGYQFDVAKGFAKAGDEYLGRSELSSFAVRVGLAF
jgi:hypothetical protein